MPNNPLFNALGGNMLNISGPLGNMTQIKQAFTQFKSTLQGNPQQKVMEMLQSGQINQQQLNQAQQMAQQLQGILK